MKRKRLLLFLIVLFPSTFWLILEMSNVNSKKLPYYGPRSFNGKDSVYYTPEEPSLSTANGQAFVLDTNRFPIYVLSFIKPEYAKEKFRLEGLLGYANYKEKNIEHIPIILVGALADSVHALYNYKDTLGIKNPNIYQAFTKASEFKAINERFFLEKPYYVDYSFLVMVDRQRHIRGYYDGRYVSEVKRLLEEYKHMRLKEEHRLIQQENKIEQVDNK